MGIPEDSVKFFTDLLFRQGLIDSESPVSSKNSADISSLLSRDQLIQLWQVCSTDECESSRLQKATKLYLREQALLAVAKLDVLLDVPNFVVVRPVDVRQNCEFAAMSRANLVRVALHGCVCCVDYMRASLQALYHNTYKLYKLHDVKHVLPS